MRNQLRKMTGFLILLMITQIVSCKFWKTECEQFCEKPEHNGIYKDFTVEKQFEYYRTCACWGDSISNKGFYIETLVKREDIVEFLVNVLKTENDPDILTDTVHLLSSVADNREWMRKDDFKGRKDIADLVNKTVAKIPEKDGRNLLSKLLGGKVKYRKKALESSAKSIEEKTKKVYEVQIR